MPTDALTSVRLVGSDVTLSKYTRTMSTIGPCCGSYLIGRARQGSVLNTMTQACREGAIAVAAMRLAVERVNTVN